MNESETRDRYSSTARITKKQAETINGFVKSGYYGSATRFVSDAIRDVSMELTRSLSSMYVIVSINHSFRDGEDLIIASMKKLFVEIPKYLEETKEKPTVLINITGYNPFMEYSISMLKKYLGLQDLQEVVSFVVFYKMRDVVHYQKGAELIKKSQEKMKVRDTEKTPDEEAEELLKKAGLIGKEQT